MCGLGLKSCLAVIGTLLVSCGPTEETVDWSLEVPTDLPDIEMPIEIPIQAMASQLRIARTSTGNRLILQETRNLFNSDGSGKERAYGAILGAGEVDLNTAQFSFEQIATGRVLLREKDSPVLAYNFGVQLPTTVPHDRKRSTYLHPVYDLDGTSLTDDFPEDHYHHRGLSWMWPQVIVAGQRHDLWHLQGVSQKFVEWLAMETGPVCATLGVKNVWLLDGRTIVDEWVWVRAFRASRLGRVLDISLTWRAVETVTLTGEGTKGYGGLCFRLSPRSDAVITNREGRLTGDSDLQPSMWADQSGLFQESRWSGVAIFQHRANAGYPAGWCLRHYGFLGVSWPGLERYALGAGELLTLRFRIWIHRGDVRAGRVEDAFAVFSKMSDFRLEGSS
jgi:hypothetical protein